MNFQDQFEACIICGAIGDAWGSSYENEILIDDSEIYYWGKKPLKSRKWQITDDTQLTLATCEALGKGKFDPEALLNTFVDYYKNNKLIGVGSSTLKAILDKESGFHWSQCGRTGEFAAGNGGAMRIAPFAFFEAITRGDIFNVCKITHRNDEAFAGSLAIYLSLKAILNSSWNGNNNLFDLIIPELPDTNVRDRLIKINELGSNIKIDEIAKLGNDGYVVNSVPFAIFCSTKVLDLGLEEMFQQIINSGGDTDTNASMAGQIAGALIGYQKIPQELIIKLKSLKDYEWIKKIVDETKLMIS